jgi:hypothetical protein
MTKRLWSGAAIACAAFLAACASSAPTSSTGGTTLGNPGALTYVLLPGSPGQPAGTLLNWVAATDPNVAGYLVYARQNSTASWVTLAITGATTYYDAETVFTQYYIASEDAEGDISSGTAVITVTYSPTIAAPDSLVGTPFDSAAKLHWSADQRLANPGIFAYYRVYSEPAVVAGGDTTCTTANPGFGLEGTTVSEDFVVTGIANGAPVCYGVTTVAQLGQESLLSAWVIVTPNGADGSFDIAMAPRATVVRHRARVTRAR